MRDHREDDEDTKILFVQNNFVAFVFLRAFVMSRLPQPHRLFGFASSRPESFFRSRTLSIDIR